MNDPSLLLKVPVGARLVLDLMDDVHLQKYVVICFYKPQSPLGFVPLRDVDPFPSKGCLLAIHAAYDASKDSFDDVVWFARTQEVFNRGKSFRVFYFEQELQKDLKTSLMPFRQNKVLHLADLSNIYGTIKSVPRTKEEMEAFKKFISLYRDDVESTYT